MTTLPAWLLSVPWPVVKAIAKTYALDPVLIGSSIMVESAGSSCATRFEPGWRYFPTDALMRDYGRKIGLSLDTVKNSMATSYGPMQTMMTVAFEHGFKDHPTRLCQPRVGIEYGAKHLATLFVRYENAEDAIAAYNAGSARRGRNGKYVNQEYVDKVMKYFNQIAQVYSIK